MKIGIFGGSFNPPHNMHRDIANYLIDNKILDKVIFVPTGTKYKYKTNLISDKDRYNMLDIISRKNKNLSVDDYELKSEVVYTIDTLTYFKNKYKNDLIYFICGTDNLTYMDKWKCGIDILSNYKILVIKRNTDLIEDILNRYNKYKNNIIVVNMPMNDISSTYIRDNKLFNNNYLDEDVVKYIKENNLYKGEKL
jgi:nicotinate-nucleotide adenylyltransferase